MVRIIAPRYAHDSGFTDLCCVFSKNSQLLLTCGSEGDVRVWDKIDSDDPVSFCCGTSVSALSGKSDRFFCSNAECEIQAYDLPDGTVSEDLGIIGKSTQTVTQICTNSANTHLLFASCDFNIKWVNISTNIYKMFAGHTAPVLSIALDPKEEFFVSAGGDGAVKVWEFVSECCVRTLSLLQKTNNFRLSEPLYRMSWLPVSGDLVAVPTSDGVKLLERGTWATTTLLKPPDEDITDWSICQFSPCGRFVAASCLSGQIFIFEWQSGDCVTRTRSPRERPLCALLWHPVLLGDIVFTDIDGFICRIESVAPVKMDNTQFKYVQVLTTSQSYATTVVSELALPRSVPNDDDDDDNSLIEENKKQNGRSPSPDSDGGGFSQATKSNKRRRLLQSDDEEDEDAEMKSDKGDNNEVDIDNDDFIEQLMADDGITRDSDIGAIKAQYSDVMAEAAGSDSVNPDVAFIPPPIVQAIPSWEPPILQKPFVCSSTPLKLPERFMKYNNVGIIKQFENEEEQSVDVEFHDTAIHHAIHIGNEQSQFTLADLNSEAVVLASRGDRDDQSLIRVMNFNSWDSSKEWVTQLPKKEYCICVSLGATFVAVATNGRHVRLFTLTGTQRQIISIPGPFITMSASGDQLAVVFHSGMGVKDEQLMSVGIYKIDTAYLHRVVRPVLTPSLLPLSPASYLSWIGFTDSGTLCSYDTDGIVRILQRAYNLCWTPVKNFKIENKNSTDFFWLTDVTEFPSPHIKAIVCKQSKHPNILPKPMIHTFQWSVPLCDPESEATKLEDLYLKTSIVAQHKYLINGLDVQSDEDGIELRKEELNHVLKLFVLACKSQREARALEVAALMPTAEAVQVLITFATNSRKMILAGKLNELAQRKLDEEIVRDGDFNIDQEQPPTQRRHVSSIKSINNYDDSSYSPNTSILDDAENISILDTSLESALFKPKERTVKVSTPASRRNPFKKAIPAAPEVSIRGLRALHETTSVNSEKAMHSSIDNVMDGVFGSKSGQHQTKRKNTNAFDSASKQPKLSFSKTIESKGECDIVPESKRHLQKMTGFTLWQNENLDMLQSKFDSYCKDNPEEECQMRTFCMKQFQTSNTSDEKKEWTRKATAFNDKQEMKTLGAQSKLNQFELADG